MTSFSPLLVISNIEPPIGRTLAPMALNKVTVSFQVIFARTGLAKIAS